MQRKLFILPIIAAILILFSAIGFSDHIFSGAGYGITAMNGTTTIANNSNVTTNGVLLNVSANETINMTAGGFAFEWINQSGVGFNITKGIMIVDNNGSTSGNYTTLNVYNLKNGTHSFRVVGWQSNITSENSSGPVIRFTVDSGKPTIVNLTQNNTNYSTASPSIAFNVTDNTATSDINVLAFVDGVPGTTAILALNNTNTTTPLVGLSNGTHTVQLQANDTAGNSRNMSDVVWITVATPTTFNVTITSPLNNTNTTNETTLDILFNLGSYVFANTLNYTVFVDRVPNGTSAFINNNTQTTFTPRDLANGTHVITIEGHDPAGTYKNASVFFTIDQIAPVPKNLTTNNTNFSTASPSFAFNVTDNTAAGAINVTLFIDGVVNGTTQLINNNTNGTISGTAVSNGTHTFVIQAIDPAGNSANTTQGTFTVATPTTLVNVTINLPATNNTNTTNVTQNLIFYSVSNIHANGLNYTVFRNGLSIASAFMSNNTATTVIPGSANGTYTYYVEVVDPSGNYKNSSTITWTIDQIRPVIRNLTANNTNFSTASPSFAFNVTDNTAVGAINVTLFIDGVVNGTTQLINNNTNGTINGRAVADGLHTYIIQAIDPAGNAVNMTQNSTFRVDTVAPTINIQNPANATNGSSTINVNFTSGDSVVAFCTLELDNVNTTNISLGACTNVSLSGLADGSHTIRIWVNDSANNVAVATRGFTVDTTGPSVSLSVSPTAPTAGTYVVVSCSASDLNSNVTTTGLTVTDPLSGVASLSCGGTYTNTNPIGTYTVKYTANDYFGNPSNATVTFTTQNPGGGSSGGGGGGGGGSGSTTALAISTNSFIGVSAGQSYDATITKTDIAIDQVTFATTSSVNSVEVRVESYGTNVPSGSAAVETTVGNGFAYQYLKIETTNLNSVLKDANVKFSVTKEWLSVNGISVNNVALYKYANSVWQKLPTLKTGESSTEVMYEATVTSFSTFVIAADKTSTAPPPTSQCGNGVCEADESQASCSADCKTSAPISRCGDGVCDADESVSSCPADCVTTPQTEQKDNAMSWAIVIVIVIILGLVYFVYTKYK